MTAARDSDEPARKWVSACARQTLAKPRCRSGKREKLSRVRSCESPGKTFTLSSFSKHIPKRYTEILRSKQGSLRTATRLLTSKRFRHKYRCPRFGRRRNH